MSGYESTRLHQGPLNAETAYHQRRRRRERNGDRFKLKCCADREELFQTARQVQMMSGRGAGPDGIRPDELTRRELGTMAGLLATQIQDGTYSPGPRRRLEIDKPSGGKRTLRIPSIGDRVVARRMLELLQPLIDPKFVESSLGFRPQRGVSLALAMIQATANHHGWRVLVVADIRKAFDTVPILEIMRAFVQLFERTELRRCSHGIQFDLLCLVAVVLLGGNPQRTIGIDTGCPFSPFALNVLLHTIFDRLFLQASNKPFWADECDGYRYADNLIFAVHDVSEGQKVLDTLRRHFTGQDLPLRDDAVVVDLRSGGKARLFGFDACCTDGQLVYELPIAAIHRLDELLDKAHDEPNPATAAYSTVSGWVAQMGPALENGRSLLPLIAGTMVSHGFRDVCSRATIENWWVAACDRWRCQQFAVQMDHGIGGFEGRSYFL